MVNIQKKRIYEPASPADGFRVLADRLWPRGVRKDAAKIDLWAKDITPSAGLREDFHGGRCPWPEFEIKYRLELSSGPSLGNFIEMIRGMETVTLLFAGKDTEHTHVNVLMDALEEKMPQLH